MKSGILVLAVSLAFGQAALVAAPAAMEQAAPSETADISGSWHFTYNTEAGDREATANFKVDDAGQVTGKWNTADVKGTYKNGDLDLAFPYESEEAAMTATLKMKGKLKEGKLVGNWEFADYTGTFSGSRDAAKAGTK